MLVKRMEEEKLIIVKEITQHCQYLRKALDKLDNLLHQIKEDTKNHIMFHKYFICIIIQYIKYIDATEQ